MKKELDGSDLVVSHNRAMRELTYKSVMREKYCSTMVTEEREADFEASRVLDTIE